MGANLSAEQQKLVQEHVAKQDAAVRALQDVIEQQGRALEAMAEVDDDYIEAQEQDDDGNDSDAGEFDQLLSLAAVAEKKQAEPEADADETGQPDVDPAEFNEDAEARGFQAVKPWLGAMAPPTGYQKNAEWDELPNVKLELEYVYGYRGRLVRNNARCIDADRVVYFAAGVGIVHNLANNTQKFFTGHDDDIISLDYHAERKLVVTGQQGRTPKTCVWDAESCQQLACLEGYHKRGVVSVAFSADGSKVATVGLDDEHSVAVYDWQNGSIVAESTGDTSRIYSVAFNRTAKADPNSDFVTVGSKHIKFWSCAGGRMKARKGLLGKQGKRQNLYCVAFTETATLVGAASGDVYTFHDNKLKNVARTNGSVFTIAINPAVIVVGGKDGAVGVFDRAMRKKRGVKVQGSARAVDFKDENTLLIGTGRSELYFADVPKGALTQQVSGHYAASKGSSELWGLAPTPGRATFATVGDDCTLRVWDVATRKQVEHVQLEASAKSKLAARACGYSPDGKLLAVGYSNGSYAVYDTTDGYNEEFRRRRRGNSRVTCVKFSPSGKLLAVAFANSSVDILDVDQEFKVTGTCKGASSAVLHVDWSADSAWLQTMSQAYELLFYDSNGEYNPRSKSLKDTQWATQECTLGWNVQGIWPKYSDGSDINTVNLSNSRKYLASAEDSGLVKLFNYPCIGSGLHPKTGKLSRRPKSQTGTGHSSHVTNANWLFDDTYLVTCGGGDLTAMQWKVVAA